MPERQQQKLTALKLVSVYGRDYMLLPEDKSFIESLADEYLSKAKGKLQQLEQQACPWHNWISYSANAVSLQKDPMYMSPLSSLLSPVSFKDTRTDSSCDRSCSEST